MATKKKTNRKGGRPSTYNFEIAKEICMMTYEMSLTNICKSSERFPDRATFFRWKREHAELRDFYVNIVRDKGDLFIEEIDQTVIDLKDGKIDPSTANVIIQTLKWKAAKFYPKMFGDKSEVDIKSDGKKLDVLGFLPEGLEG
jgi:hypothetical protein